MGALGVAGCGGSSHPANTTAAADVNGPAVVAGTSATTTGTSTASGASSATGTTSASTTGAASGQGQGQGNGASGAGSTATGGAVGSAPNDPASSHGNSGSRPAAHTRTRVHGKTVVATGTGAAGSGTGSSSTGAGSSSSPGAPSASTGIPYEVDTTSMEPSFQPETKIYYDPTRTHPQIGEVVVFYLPAGAEEGACGTVMAGGRACATPVPGTTKSKEISFKRVVGLPGDSIAVDAGHVIRNGQPESEPQTIPCEKNERLSCEFPTPITVPAGDYYVMSDNRGLYKEDSRLLGAIPQEYILGTVEGG